MQSGSMTMPFFGWRLLGWSKPCWGWSVQRRSDIVDRWWNTTNSVLSGLSLKWFDCIHTSTSVVHLTIISHRTSSWPKGHKAITVHHRHNSVKVGYELWWFFWCWWYIGEMKKIAQDQTLQNSILYYSNWWSLVTEVDTWCSIWQIGCEPTVDCWMETAGGIPWLQQNGMIDTVETCWLVQRRKKNDVTFVKFFNNVWKDSCNGSLSGVWTAVIGLNSL